MVRFLQAGLLAALLTINPCPTETPVSADAVQETVCPEPTEIPKKQIALTFDDGPSRHTSRLLDFLEEQEIHVTFFLVGDRVCRFSDTVKRQAQNGHELGYHSYGHQDQTRLSCERISSDYLRADGELSALTGQSYTLWRAPGGAFDRRVLNEVPLPHIHWSVDTRDWETKNSLSVYRAILSSAEDGAIILLHDLYGTTVDGAIRAIQELLSQGYEFVTVSELLSRDGTEPQKCINYYKD